METYFTCLNLYYTWNFCSLYFTCHHFGDSLLYFCIVFTHVSPIFNGVTFMRLAVHRLSDVKLPLIGQKCQTTESTQRNFPDYSSASEHVDCSQVMTSE